VIKGALRTDFILSASIMVIALNEVAAQGLALRTATLIVRCHRDHGAGLWRGRRDREDGRHRARSGEADSWALSARWAAALSARCLVC
jgi:hypothetical protein